MNHLDVKCVDWSTLLKNDSTWAVRKPYTDKKKELQPYTECTGLSSGWVWNGGWRAEFLFTRQRSHGETASPSDDASRTECRRRSARPVRRPSGGHPFSGVAELSNLASLKFVRGGYGFFKIPMCILHRDAQHATVELHCTVHTNEQHSAHCPSSR